MATKIQWNIPKENQEKTIAVVYARFSSHSQGEQSIEAQVSEAHKYAAAHGYTIVHEYIDRAKTGRTDNREQFQQMLKDTSKKQFEVIIVWKVDRFGRNREEIALNKMRCKKNGVRVEYIAENIPNTPEGVILESVLEGFAEYYSLQLSQNVRRGLSASAEKCQSTGGNRPMGYLTGPDKKFVIDPVTAPTVKMIFQMYADGKTVTEIINHLNGLGLHNQKGKPFNKNSLYSILKNEKYTGVYIWQDQRIEGGMPRIIDNQTFWKVQDLIKTSKRTPANKWNKADYILTEKLFCGKCGSPMIGESGTGKMGVKYNYYTCNQKKYQKKCDKKPIRQDLIESTVINATVDLLKDDELIRFLIDHTWEYYLSQNDSQEEIETLKKQLQQVQTAMENLVRAAELGMVNEVTQKRMKELEDQKTSLIIAITDREITEKFHVTKEYMSFFFHRFKTMNYSDPKCQKQLIATFVNSVYLFDDNTLTINYNFTTDSKTISLAELQSAEDKNEFVQSLPCFTKK